MNYLKLSLRPSRHQMINRNGATRRFCGVDRLESRVLLSRSWFVSVAGSDKNPGTLAQPFQTIQEAAAMAGPGDTVYILGGTYHETVTPALSGTAAAPITFTAYKNEAVTIDGADPITGWSKYQGSIYTALQPWDLASGNNEVFVNGQMMTGARWPNTSPIVSDPTYAEVTAVQTTTPGTASLYSDTAILKVPSLSDQNGGGGWVGATVHINSGQGWNVQTGTVLASSAGSLTVAFEHQTNYETPTAGNQIYLTGKLRALDAADEWYRDPTTGELYLWAPGNANPSTSGIVVEAKRRDFGFELSNRAYINVTGINLFACTIDTNSASNHLIFNNLAVKYVSQVGLDPSPWDGDGSDGPTGILINGSDITLSKSTIAYSSGNGVSVAGSNNTVIGCTIHDADYGAGNEAGISVTGSGQMISGNTIYDCGRDGILASSATASQIVHNNISHVGLQTTDLGGIYTWGTNGQGTVIAYNTISDITTHGKGFGGDGIYLDNGSSNYIVHDNTVSNVDIPLKLNPPSYDNNVYDNTLNGKFVKSSPSPNSSLSNAARSFNGKAANLSILPTLGGFEGTANAINASGVVVGVSLTGTSQSVFRDTTGSLANLGTLGGSYGSAAAINAGGDVVGSSMTVAGKRHAFLLKNGQFSDLGTLPNNVASIATAVNATDAVVGTSYNLGGIGQAFLDSDGTMRAIGTLGGQISQAFGINDAGDVVGASTVAGDQNAHAFLYTGGKLQDLGTLGGSSSYATAINNNGAIVGESLVSGNGAFHAFIYENGKMHNLGTVGGFKNSVATAINSNGDVVGFLYNSDTSQYHAFFYHDGKMVDLNTLVPAGANWVLTSANGINDKDQVVGVASSGVWSRAFVLSVL